MSAPFYRMPPLPGKTDLLRQLLTGPHATELLIGAGGKPVLAIIMHTGRLDDAETRLYQQVLKLLVQAGADRSAPAELSPTPGIRGQAVFRLQADLWVDLDRYEVRRGDERISLRAREADLLRILLRQPRCYVRAEALAEALGAEGSEEIEHPVEGIVSSVRQKLGEIPYQPKLLRCKRYAGYAIFPDEPEPAGAAAARPEAVGAGHL